MLRVICVIACLSALTACSTIPPNTIQIKIESTPSAAVLYSPSGKMIGLTPYTGYYELTASDIATGSVSGGNVTAVWYSGARATVNTDVRLNGLTSGTVTFSLQRPMSAPGALQDIEFAEARTRRQAAESQAGWEALADVIASRNRPGAAPLANPYPSVVTPARSTATWTGGMRQVQTVTYQQGVSCEYNFVGRLFWRTFVGAACPSTVEVQ